MLQIIRLAKTRRKRCCCLGPYRYSVQVISQYVMSPQLDPVRPPPLDTRMDEDTSCVSFVTEKLTAPETQPLCHLCGTHIKNSRIAQHFRRRHNITDKSQIREVKEDMRKFSTAFSHKWVFPSLLRWLEPSWRIREYFTYQHPINPRRHWLFLVLPRHKGEGLIRPPALLTPNWAKASQQNEHIGLH